MIGTNKEKAYNDAKKCLDQLLANDQIPFYGYIEIMLQLDAMKRERPHGEWVVDEEHSITMTFYKCTNCNFFGGADWFNFCPNCGAKMEVK